MCKPKERQSLFIISLRCKPTGSLSGRRKLAGVNFIDANLCGANLSMANLSPDNMCVPVMLHSADLSEALLVGANVVGANYDVLTKFPKGFDPSEHLMEFVDSEPRLI
jgi:uncharacterized protein YjbI with pentapeptide repeats